MDYYSLGLSKNPKNSFSKSIFCLHSRKILALSLISALIAYLYLLLYKPRCIRFPLNLPLHFSLVSYGSLSSSKMLFLEVKLKSLYRVCCLMVIIVNKFIVFISIFQLWKIKEYRIKKCLSIHSYLPFFSHSTPNYLGCCV